MSLLPRSVEKRPIRWRLEIQIELHFRCNRLYFAMQHPWHDVSCMCVWMYECMSVCVYVCMNVWVTVTRCSVYVCMNVWVYECVCVCVYVCVIVCMRLCMYGKCVYTYIYAYICMYMRSSHHNSHKSAPQSFHISNQKPFLFWECLLQGSQSSGLSGYKPFHSTVFKKSGSTKLLLILTLFICFLIHLASM